MLVSRCRVVALAALTMATRGMAMLAVAIACMLVACGDPPPASVKPAPAAAAPAASKTANLSNEMVAAVSAGKTSAAVSVHFALGAPPTVGNSLPVQIAIVPHRKFTSLRVHFEAQDGLSVTAGEDFGLQTDADTEKALLHKLMLMPDREGVFMVTTSVDTESDEGNVVRIFSIPVIVSPAQPHAPAETTNPAPVSPATK
jgi:hypothetical protein